MAGNSCSLTCNVKDSDGKIKVSALWNDLMQFFKKDRREAIVHYFLTKDPYFLSQNGRDLRFDVNGEVTIESLKKALDRDGEYGNLSNSLVLRKLNEDIQNDLRKVVDSRTGAVISDGRVNYSEALDAVLKFNSSDRFKENFMATMKRKDDGTYLVEVIKRNPQSEYDLALLVQNKILTDAIRLVLQDKGLSVEFLDNPNYAVQYSTQNAFLDADGFMAVASVLDGSNSKAEVAEAAGHFIAAAMEGNPLLERLLNVLTPEVQEAIFKGNNAEYRRDDFIVSKDAREAAGILIGKSLLKPFEAAQKNAWGGAGLNKATARGIMYLLKKIGTFAKHVFGSMKPKDIRRMTNEAKAAAEHVAQGFIANPNDADVGLALSREDTFSSDYASKYLKDSIKRKVNTYRETLGNLKDAINRLSASVNRATDSTNKQIYKNLTNLAKDVSAKYSHQMNMAAFADNASVVGMIEMLRGITNILDTDVRSLLDQIQPSDKAGSYINIVNNSRNMRTVNTTVKSLLMLYDVLKDKIDTLDAKETVNYDDLVGNRVVDSLRDALDRLGDVLLGRVEEYKDIEQGIIHVNGLMGLLEEKRRQVFSDAIAEFYGSNTIEYNAGIVWKQKAGGKIKVLGEGKKRPVNVKDYIKSLEEDISWFDRHLSAAADCGDFIVAVGNKVTKEANMNADRVASRFWDRIETLRLQMMDAFGHDNTRILFETIIREDGREEKTGNLISKVNYGAWEEARNEFKKELKIGFGEYMREYRKNYYENNKGVKGAAFNLSDEQRAVLYHEYSAPLWDKWHEEHSEKEKTSKGERWVPNHVKYHNQRWYDLFDSKNPGLTDAEKVERDKRLKWYNALLELKRDADNLLPKNATVSLRAPQITGRFGHKFRNLKAKHGGNMIALGGALRREVHNTFVVKPDEAWMFGSNNEFNELEEDPMENPIFFEKEKIDRLPLFGINKLKNMEDLNTDLFSTLLSYSSMAATYNAMERVVDVFELGRDVLKKRTVGNIEEKERKGESRAYSRYAKFIEKSIYGINVVPPSWDRKGVLRKFSNTLSSLGGRILLWGNLHGGIVNTGTGQFEIFKEAAAGENFTLSEVGKAHGIYYNGVLSSDGYLGTVSNMLTNAQRPDDKNSLWIRHWNILSQNRQFLHNQRYDVSMNLLDNRLWDWFGHALMLPYSSGDHYMQTIPYLAMGIHDKVYDRDGNEMSLIDAYEVVDGEEVHPIDAVDGSVTLGRTPKKLKLKEGIFKSVDDIVKYNEIQRFVNKLSDYFEAHPNMRPRDSIALDLFTDDDIKYLEEQKFTIPATNKDLITLKTALIGKLKNLTYNTTDESEFMDKCRNICNRLHGIYNSEDKVAFQQIWYGNLVTSMRGYALGMVNRRFADSRYNVPQKKVVEGSYNTALKVFLSAIYNANNMYNWKATAEALLLTIPGFNMYALFSEKYGNRLKADMQAAGFSEHQYYNMRRTGADFLVLEALALMNFLTAPGSHFGLESDDDDEEADTFGNWLAGLAYYFSMRWFNEQAAFTLPTLGGMYKEGISLLDWVPAGLSGSFAMLDIIWALLKLGADNIGEPDFENSDIYYQQSKRGKYEQGDAKAWVKFKRLCPYIRTWYAMAHPYDAASSYEYGRRVRGR